MSEGITKFTRILRSQELVRLEILTASREFLDCPVAVLSKTCNGCGASDSKFDFVPDTMWGLYVGYSCMIHDYDYAQGSSETDRRFADERFLSNLRSYIEYRGGFLKYPRYARAYLYYKAVRLKGSAAFWGTKLRLP